MSESGDNIPSNQNDGGSLPNITSNTDSSNNNNNNNTDNSNNSNTNNSTSATGNNITVSIEYRYDSPNIPVTQNNIDNNNSNRNATDTGSTNSTSASSQPRTTAAASATSSTSQQSQQQTTSGGMRPFPPGVVFLQFRDIPAGNTQERLQAIMNIASEIAVRRMVDFANVRYNRGITKEKFESLPVIPVKDLDPTVREDGCSICYEPFVDPIQKSVSDGSKKRNREDGEGADSENNERNKRSRSDLTNDTHNNNDNNNDNNTISIDRLPTNIENSSTSEAVMENATTNTNNNGAQTLNDENTNPTYDHSAVEAPCKHIFGRECLYKWCMQQNTCPLCRHVIAESVNTPIEVDPAQAAAATNAAFQRIHDLLYNTNNNNNNNNNNSNSAENNNDNRSATDASSDSNSNNSRRSVSTQQSSISTLPTNVPYRTSNIIFLTPQWYSPPGSTAGATTPATSDNSASSSTNNIGTENSDTQTRSDSTDNNSNNMERPSPYERFRAIIGSYFDGLMNHNNNNNNNTSNTNNTNNTNASSTSGSSATNDNTTSSNIDSNTNSSFSVSSGNVQNATRNLDLLAMGNSIRNALLQHRSITPGTYNNSGAPTLFGSGVASYRTPSGNVSTYHLGAHEVFHASGNNGNGSNTTATPSTDNQNDGNINNGTSSRSNEQEEEDSSNESVNTSTS